MSCPNCNDGQIRNEQYDRMDQCYECFGTGKDPMELGNNKIEREHALLAMLVNHWVPHSFIPNGLSASLNSYDASMKAEKFFDIDELRPKFDAMRRFMQEEAVLAYLREQQKVVEKQHQETGDEPASLRT